MFLVNNAVTISLLVLLILGDLYKDKKQKNKVEKAAFYKVQLLILQI
jgi:competence protein ComGC